MDTIIQSFCFEDKNVLSHAGTKGMKWYQRWFQSYATKPTRSGKIGEEFGEAAERSANYFADKFKERRRNKILSDPKLLEKHQSEFTVQEVKDALEKQSTINKMKENSRASYVAKHKDKILSNPKLTMKYKNDLTADEIRSAFDKQVQLKKLKDLTSKKKIESRIERNPTLLKQNMYSYTKDQVDEALARFKQEEELEARRRDRVDRPRKWAEIGYNYASTAFKYYSTYKSFEKLYNGGDTKKNDSNPLADLLKRKDKK